MRHPEVGEGLCRRPHPLEERKKPIGELIGLSSSSRCLKEVDLRIYALSF